MKKFFVTFFLVFVVSGIYSNELYFGHLGVDDGLSQNSVLSICQDQFGYMWFGTIEGLNRYDSKSIKKYFSEDEDRTGLTSNVINKIYSNGDYLYLQCAYSQFVVYDMKVDKFTLINDECQTIGWGRENIWYASNGMIKKYSYDTKKIVDCFELNNQSEISCLLENSNGRLYIGTDKGLYFYDESKTINHILSNSKVISLFEDSKKNIWVGTDGNGFYLVDRTGLVNHYTTSQGLSNNVVRAFCEDDLGEIWIATFDGLNKMIPATRQFFVYRNIDGKPTGLSHNSIHSLFTDKQGTVWIGTYFGGVNYYHPISSFYSYYYPNTTNFGSVNFPVLSKITEDGDGNIWICTEGGGLNFFNRKTKKFRYYTSEMKNSISHNNLKCIHYNEKNNKLYIGTHTGGLNIYDIRNDKFKYLTDKTDNKFPNNIIVTIFEYKKELIVLTKNGILKLNPDTDEFVAFTMDADIEGYIRNLTYLFIDSKDNLWLTLAQGGLLRYNLNDKKLKTYFHSKSESGSISHSPISYIYEISNGELLFSTQGSGIYKYVPEKDGFEQYSARKNMFLSDFIYYINETKNGYLLLLTNIGINLLDKNLKTIFSFDQTNGFPLKNINFDSGACVAKNGEIFIAGANGMVSFFENQISVSSKDYNLFFSDLFIHNKEQTHQNNPDILPQTLPYLRQIKLKHDQANFSIKFAVANFILSNKSNFDYQLGGFDKGWYTTNDNTIRYSNISPGKYVLRVRENFNLNNKSNQKPKEISLIIQVDPPFYFSNIAYVLYVLILLAIAWFFIYSYKSRLKLKTSLEFEVRESDRIQALNQTKLQFFTNVSHEFRTPLTLIIGQLDTLVKIKNLPEAVSVRLNKINKHVLHLMSLVNELLDFRKQESNKLVLNYSNLDLVIFLNEIFLSFYELSVKRKIAYSFSSSHDEIMLWFDPVQMQKVFYNLLSNAFKYTDDYGTIALAVEKKEKAACVYIIDSGVGMSTEDIPYIFDRFYQGKCAVDRQNVGTGIGLALSKGIVEAHGGNVTAQNNQEKGATFTVCLSLGNEHVVEKANATDVNLKNRHISFSESIFYEDVAEIKRHSLDAHSTILIVEDNEDILEFLVETFSPYYQVETACNGFDAFEKVKEMHPDIVLADILMPKMSGKEMCARLKSNFDTSHIPIVLITADTSTQQNLDALIVGADDYITKPFNVEVLINRCNNLVLSRKNLQKIYSKDIENIPFALTANKNDQELLERATELVTKYIDDPEFNINKFASELFLSRSSLYLKINGITGMTPNEFIVNIRLKRAANLLIKHSYMSVSDIAYSVGFNTPRYFSKCFKDFFGVSPFKYRQTKVLSE